MAENLICIKYIEFHITEPCRQPKFEGMAPETNIQFQRLTILRSNVEVSGKL